MLQIQHFQSIAQHFRGACQLGIQLTNPLPKISLLKCRFQFQSTHSQSFFFLDRRICLILKQLRTFLMFKKCAKDPYVKVLRDNQLSRTLCDCQPICLPVFNNIPIYSLNMFSNTTTYQSGRCWTGKGFLLPLVQSSRISRSFHTCARRVDESKTVLLTASETSASLMTKRFKQPKRMGRGKYGEEETQTSDDSDDEAEEVDDVDKLEELSDAPKGYKLMKVHIKSLRADAIVSSGLNIARNKVDDIFYNSKLLVNGEKLLKKSKQLSEGDYVDLVTSVSEDIMKVKRVQLVKVLSERTKSDKQVAWVRTWKAGFEIDKPNKFKTENSEV